MWSITTVSLAQPLSDHPVAMTPKKRETRPFNDSLFRVKVYDNYKGKFRLEGRLQEFTAITTESAKELFNSNQIYTNLDDETAFIKKIIVKTIPREYLGDNVKVYIVRDPSINAYCREDGSIFIHIGLLSILDNEAELAGILSHEFGHYYSRHSLKGYKRYKNTVALNVGFSFLGFLGYIPRMISIARFYKESRKQEKACDLFAVKFFKQNQYASDGIVSAQHKLFQISSIYKKRTGSKKSVAIFSTHPSSDVRMSYLKKNIVKNGLEAGNNYMVDSAGFEKLRRRAADETVYLDFSLGDLDACIERAYLYHIYYPGDEFYTYFLTEALRRKLDLFPFTKNDYFITSAFKNLKATGKANKRDLKSIHYNLWDVYGWELQACARYSKSPNQALLDRSQVEFVSNAEALAYFLKEAEEKCEGCYSIFKALDKKYERPSVDDQKTEFESALYEQTFLLPASSYNSNKEQCYPFFLNNYYQGARGKKKFSTYTIPEDSYLKTDLSNHNNSQKSGERCADILYLPELNFRETYQVNAWLNLISRKLMLDNKPGSTEIRKKQVFTGSSKVLKTWVNLESDFPELLLMAKKYSFKKLYFADLTENTASRNRPGSIFGAQIYCLDFSTNTVTRHSYQSMPSFFPDYSGCYSEITGVISEVFAKTK